MVQNSSSSKTQQNKHVINKEQREESTEATQQASFKGQCRNWEWPLSTSHKDPGDREQAWGSPVSKERDKLGQNGTH